MQVRTLPSIGRINIKLTRRYVEILIPTRRDQVFEIYQAGLPGGGVTGMTWFFVGWNIIGLGSSIYYSRFFLDPSWFRNPGIWLMFVFGALWLWAEIAIGRVLAEVLFGKERLLIGEHQLTTGYFTFGFGKAQQYELAQMTNIRSAPRDQPPAVYFDYAGRTISIGTSLRSGLKFAETETIAKYLTDIVTFRCHRVLRIIFGAAQHLSDDGQITLCNPDVTDVTFPFVRLKEVVIDTTTYNFHLVERFLTYAVNSIGQNYLKNHVEVQIYGDPEQLHPNLRNSLTNLCKQIEIHQIEKEQEKKMN